MAALLMSRCCCVVVIVVVLLSEPGVAHTDTETDSDVDHSDAPDSPQQTPGCSRVSPDHSRTSRARHRHVDIIISFAWRIINIVTRLNLKSEISVVLDVQVLNPERKEGCLVLNPIFVVASRYHKHKPMDLELYMKWSAMGNLFCFMILFVWFLFLWVVWWAAAFI